MINIFNNTEKVKALKWSLVLMNVQSYHQNLQLPLGLWSFIMSFSLLLSCPITLVFWFTLKAYIMSFLAAASCCFTKKTQHTSKNPLCTTCPAPNSRQTHEQLAAEHSDTYREPNTFSSSCLLFELFAINIKGDYMWMLCYQKSYFADLWLHSCLQHIKLVANDRSQ